MKVGERHYRSIWIAEDGRSIDIIDQTRLPHAFVTARLQTVEAAATAIRTMQVRGAPLIGATAAYGVCLALRADDSADALRAAVSLLGATRPTAVNLAWALERMEGVLVSRRNDRVQAAYDEAGRICEEDIATCRAIGTHGLELIEKAQAAKGADTPVNVLTHCNAGGLATVDYGTALAPLYLAHDQGVPVHVWVDETRPRGQGALTAWELGQHGVPHTLIADNAGGHLMQRGEVDLCITGTDRTTANGDVCNKIGTYLKALAAHDNGVPFYVALPHSTIDWRLDDGGAVPIEERSADEVGLVQGLSPSGEVIAVRVAPAASDARNPAFDVTPARLIAGLVTERGVCPASAEGLLSLYPERRGTGVS